MHNVHVHDSGVLARSWTERERRLETVSTIAWLIDDVDDALELVGLAVIGTGFLALAWQSMRAAAPPVAWGRLTGLVGLVLLATAAAYAVRAFGLVDLLLVVGGVLLLPAWLGCTGRILRERRVQPVA